MLAGIYVNFLLFVYCCCPLGIKKKLFVMLTWEAVAAAAFSLALPCIWVMDAAELLFCWRNLF